MITRRKTLAALGALALGATNAFAAMSDKDKKKARDDINKMEGQILAKLYKVQPGAKKTVENAAGYATFSNFGVKIFFAGSGKGAGVAINNKTKSRMYMKMFEVQAGLGLGVKKFALVWVFDNASALDKFVNSGWEIGGQANATAKVGAKGDAYSGAMSVSPGVWLYQLAGDGLAVELTGKGTKYYKDDDLN
jgi:lipid-binding SYLF domain-containing protein